MLLLLLLLLLLVVPKGEFEAILKEGTTTPEEVVVPPLLPPLVFDMLRRGVPDILGVGFGMEAWPETFPEASVCRIKAASPILDRDVMPPSERGVGF